MGRHPRSHKRKTLIAKLRSKKRGMKGWKITKGSIFDVLYKKKEIIF